MSGLTFRQPEIAWWLIAAAVVILAGQLAHRRHFAAIATRALLPSRYRASWLRRLPLLVALAGVGAVALAAMDPVLPFAEERVASRGLDIAIVLDLSSSMEETMGGAANPHDKRTRLTVTKQAINGFIARRPEDRIGIVVFSDNAYVVSPLTVDHPYLKRYVAMIDEQILRTEGMTAIGEGLAVADTLLRRQAAPDERREQVIVVFTDGEYNHGRDPVAALEQATDAGHRVHLIGVDLNEEVKQKAEVLRLVNAVQTRGGRYFTADTERQLTAASDAIDELETGMLVSRRTIRNAPAYEAFASAAILCLCSALALRAVPFFIDLT